MTDAPTHLSIAAALIATTAWTIPASAAAEAQHGLLGDLFQDNAVLQRDRPIAVWGAARPGEVVTVALGDRKATAQADKTGRWSAQLPALPAGGPYELTVASAGGTRETIRNVLLGDVWLCSGQSNMEFPVKRALDAANEIQRSADSDMRLLTIARDTSLTPLDDLKTPVRWQAASPETVPEFSAACYFMARELRQSQKVPMGLIDASWGGTAIDAWRSERAIEASGESADRLAVLQAYKRDPLAGIERWGALWENWWRNRTGDKPGTEPWQTASNDAPGWKPVPHPGAWETYGDPELASFNGMVWFRTTVTLTAEQASKPARLDIGWADELDLTWVNGVAVGSAYGPGSGRDYALPKGLLKPGVNHIVVNVLDTYGAGGLAGPEDLRTICFNDGTAAPLGGDWEYRVVPTSVGHPPRAPWETNAGLSPIYNAMIAPLANYGLRGVAWYQGESDADAGRGYARKLTSMIQDWRRQFGNAQLPFLVVQLAGWGPSPARPVESGFATVRDEQRLAVSADPHAGLALTVDIGDRGDIHPANKQVVGQRLARAARNVAYGEAITPSGPEVEGATRSDGGVVVTFKNVDGTLLTYSAATAIGFELCGAQPETCRFVDGKVDGNTVHLTPLTPTDTRVRFCWGDSPVCNLYDSAGLPAGPFETSIRQK